MALPPTAHTRLSFMLKIQNDGPTWAGGGAKCVMGDNDCAYLRGS
jgi:hypothetical protein